MLRVWQETFDPGLAGSADQVGVRGLNLFSLLLASGFGSGLSPILPGTAGTIVAIPIYYLLSSLPWVLYTLIVGSLFFLSVFVSAKAQEHWGKKDDRRIVIDEIKVVGSRCGPFGAALRLLEKKLIDVESMIEAVYPLADGLAAFDHASGSGSLKVLLQP